MTDSIIWQQDSTNPDNATQLTQIDRWWQDLNFKRVSWQQRLIPDTEDINWEPQRFDETFTLQMPQIRGITLYWHKSTLSGDERSITPHKLILDPIEETLDIYPQSQSNLVIRISKLGIAYQKIELNDPLIVGKQNQDSYLLLLRDKQQRLEIKINLSPDSLQQLLNNLPQKD
jgi:hypothetical protein